MSTDEVDQGKITDAVRRHSCLKFEMTTAVKRHSSLLARTDLFKHSFNIKPPVPRLKLDDIITLVRTAYCPTKCYTPLAALSTKPHTCDPSLMPLPGPVPNFSNRILHVGIMMHDNIVMPHPPTLQASALGKQKLEASPNIEMINYRSYKHDDGTSISTVPELPGSFQILHVVRFFGLLCDVSALGEDKSAVRVTISGNLGPETEEIIDEYERGVETGLVSFFAAVLEGKDGGFGDPLGALKDVAIIQAALNSDGHTCW
ncbi:hypothetical protein BJ138DRAFT_1102720 [Hygrophoropsis aurantiaca]|uniref:Uncharacterized protein n=1 Tax=Hygrophoropsis aurantiaca TaxID=72124 RepID=A0ACB8A9M0_9AGAM|nr:hypothetical protein BJ138DRAFT_1102720 [Hygrophoropsis aurantiaca]